MKEAFGSMARSRIALETGMHVPVKQRYYADNSRVLDPN
jgi:hypothetical protein